MGSGGLRKTAASFKPQAISPAWMNPRQNEFFRAGVRPGIKAMCLLMPRNLSPRLSAKGEHAPGLPGYHRPFDSAQDAQILQTGNRNKLNN
jgi:hypothetical protein